ncbi:MAG: hypothetical protein IJ764_01895 [Bacteroidales bacterium]|nr:hypothetical protein [Bacteroidales bacterium]
MLSIFLCQSKIQIVFLFQIINDPFDKDATIRALSKSLARDCYLSTREYQYKNVLRRIIAEQFLPPDSGSDSLTDYKFFCFGGKPHYCQVITGRGFRMCMDFFDQEWNHQPFQRKNYPFADIEPRCPEGFVTMWHLAERLSSGIPFVRVDFYNVNGHIFFGEITFYPASGMCGFDPEEWDYIFGRLINLPQ